MMMMDKTVSYKERHPRFGEIVKRVRLVYWGGGVGPGVERLSLVRFRVVGRLTRFGFLESVYFRAGFSFRENIFFIF